MRAATRAGDDPRRLVDQLTRRDRVIAMVRPCGEAGERTEVIGERHRLLAVERGDPIADVIGDRQKPEADGFARNVEIGSLGIAVVAGLAGEAREPRQQ
jgi:hypothetical protein